MLTCRTPRPGQSESSDDEPGGLSSSACDYTIVGGGDGSISAAYYLAEVFKKANKPISILVIEEEDRLGGNVFDVDSLTPQNYYNTRAVFSKLSLKLGVGCCNEYAGDESNRAI